MAHGRGVADAAPAPRPAIPPAPARGGATPWTIGVEQQFLLVDARTREPVSRNATVSAADGQPVASAIARGPYSGVTALGDRLRDTRRRLVRAAWARGCRLVATGTAPLSAARDGRDTRAEPGTGDRAADGDTYGCHIHMGPFDADTAIEISNRFRPWLPALLALTANSPVRHNADTGYASSRYLRRSTTSPVSGPPPLFDSPTEYRQLTRALISSGLVARSDMIRWDLRVAPLLPSLELHMPDIAGTVDELTLLADLCLALVRTAIADAERGIPPPRPPSALLRAACLRAATDGLRGMGIALSDGALVPAWAPVNDLLRHVAPALDAHGRAAIVAKQVAWLRAEGGGADRQRRIFEHTHDARRLVDLLAEQTESAW